MVSQFIGVPKKDDGCEFIAWISGLFQRPYNGSPKADEEFAHGYPINSV
jgi:hypothetical protein